MFTVNVVRFLENVNYLSFENLEDAVCFAIEGILDNEFAFINIKDEKQNTVINGTEELINTYEKMEG